MINTKEHYCCSVWNYTFRALVDHVPVLMPCCVSQPVGTWPILGLDKHYRPDT